MFVLNNETIRLIDNKPGVYQIRLYYNKKPLPIHRLVCIDNLGILAIGSSNNVRRRLKQFLNSINGRFGHSAGNRYYHCKLKKKLKPHSLKFTIRLCDDYKKEEARLIKGYLFKFGEVPPLNNSEPGDDLFNSLNAKSYPKGYIWK